MFKKLTLVCCGAILMSTSVYGTEDKNQYLERACDYEARMMERTATRHGTCPGSEQTRMLMKQDEGLLFPSYALKTTAKRHGTPLGSQQTKMLMEQDEGLLWWIFRGWGMKNDPWTQPD